MELTPVTILLLVAILLAAAASGADAEAMRVVLDGEHALDGPTDLLVVVDGDVTIGEDATLPAAYVAGGDVRVEGTVTGDLVLLGGNLTVADGARVDGTVQAIGGTVDVADGATVVGGVDRGVPLQRTGTSPTALVLQSLVLSAVAALLVRWRPAAVATVGDAARSHPVVSVTVGALATIVSLALAVLMVFTIVLVPVGILLGLVGGLVVAYGVVALGAELGDAAGTRLAALADRLALGDRPALSAALGVLVVELVLVGLSYVPVVGALVALAVFAGGVGAVLVTGFGLRPFEPPVLD